MSKPAAGILAGCLALAACGCRRSPQPPPPPEPAPAKPRPGASRSPRILGRRATFDFRSQPLPQAISRLARKPGVEVAVSESIPLDQWATYRVTLRMADVTVRDFLDWLVRPLRAEYASEAGGAVWLTRGDDLLLSEPLGLRVYRVPTFFAAGKPVRGALNFAKEQEHVLETLRACLRYLFDRRPGCRLAFHGEQDILAARLTPRGHERLATLLDAMRYGIKPPPAPEPSAAEIRRRLAARVQWEGRRRTGAQALLDAGQQAGVNLGWDPAAVGRAEVALRRGTHTLAEVLDAVIAQSRLARFAVEPGRGIWLYAEGQESDYPRHGATPWDRAVVRTYAVGPLLRDAESPEWVLEELRRRVDRDRWERGLPAAAVFIPTRRLVVVHHAEGQERVADAVRALLAGVGPASSGAGER
ncbi:MAG: hypothetical protein ACLF0G_05575 [Candidatus Brocadiia bacterium]